MADGIEWFGDDFKPDKEDCGQDTALSSGAYNFVIPYVGFTTIKSITEMKKRPRFLKITRNWHKPYITAFFDMYINLRTAHIQKRGKANQLVELRGLGITVVQGADAETRLSGRLG